MKSFSELTGKEKAVEFLRWAFVPCAALLAVIVPGVIARFLMPPALAQPPGTPRVPPSDFQRFYLPWTATIFLAAAFVFAGARAAPRRRVATAVVLAALWTLYSLMWYVLVHPVRDFRHYTQFLVATLAAASGAAAIASSERSRSTPR